MLTLSCASLTHLALYVQYNIDIQVASKIIPYFDVL